MEKNKVKLFKLKYDNGDKYHKVEFLCGLLLEKDGFWEYRNICPWVIESGDSKSSFWKKYNFSDGEWPCRTLYLYQETDSNGNSIDFKSNPNLFTLAVDYNERNEEEVPASLTIDEIIKKEIK